MKQKTYILTVSDKFPACHPKHGTNTFFPQKIINVLSDYDCQIIHRNTGEDIVISDRKIHTCRANIELWRKRAAAINSGKAILSIRRWSGTPYRTPQVEIARLEKLGIQEVEAAYSSTESLPRVCIDGKEVPVQTIAKNDGLSLYDFIDWFFSKENHFKGACLQFTDFRY